MNSRINDIFEYEQLLMGKKTNFRKTNLLSSKDREKKVGNIWNYAITELLNWTPKEASKFLTEEIVVKLKLDKTYPIIGYVPTQTYKGDFRKFLQYAFPDQIKFDFVEETLEEFKHVAKIEKWSNDKGFYRYPKNFFRGNEGLQRARICLQYVLSLYMSDYTIEEQYEFFSDDKKANIWLKKYSLLSPAKMIFQSDYLFYYHYSLRNEQKDELIYNALVVTKRFKKEREQILLQLKKNRQ